MPGRTTGGKDGKWLADVLWHGLLKASFLPLQPLRDLRDLVRSRKTLLQERSRESNRVQKVLETAKSKRSSVASEVMGASGRSLIHVLITGEPSPEALRGRVDAHHQIVLSHVPVPLRFVDQMLFLLTPA